MLEAYPHGVVIYKLLGGQVNDGAGPVVAQVHRHDYGVHLQNCGRHLLRSTVQTQLNALFSPSSCLQRGRRGRWQSVEDAVFDRVWGTNKECLSSRPLWVWWPMQSSYSTLSCKRVK